MYSSPARSRAEQHQAAAEQHHTVHRQSRLRLVSRFVSSRPVKVSNKLQSPISEVKQIHYLAASTPSDYLYDLTLGLAGDVTVIFLILTCFFPQYKYCMFFYIKSSIDCRKSFLRFFSFNQS